MSKDPTTEQLVMKADSLAAPKTTAHQDRRAALTICDLAPDPDAAIIPLQALGLLPSESAAHRWDSVGIPHGTRSAAEWHRENHTAFCTPCLRWVEVNDRAENAKQRIAEGD